MVITRNPTEIKRHLHYSGINHVATVDSETEIFRAYIEFAYHHTQKDVDAYDNAVSDSRLDDQKILFVQLACMKREVIDKLKMHRSDASLMYDAEKKQHAAPSLEKNTGEEPGPFPAKRDAFDFAWQRENRTLLLYEKLAQTVRLTAVKVLFDFLMESQRRHLLFLTTQSAAVQCAA